jgi:hypothetical protein
VTEKVSTSSRLRLGLSIAVSALFALGGIGVLTVSKPAEAQLICSSQNLVAGVLAQCPAPAAGFTKMQMVETCVHASTSPFPGCQSVSPGAVSVDATCPPGTALTGGGWHSSQNVTLGNDGPDFNTWRVRAFNLADTHSLTVRALCIS